MAFFSVVIPTFNRCDLLTKTLESIFAQNCTDFEVIVIDDGSTDGTTEYVRGLGNKVRLFEQTNRGAGPARNLGATHANGKYLAFLDSDDLWFPWTLEVYKEVIEQNHEPSFIAGKPFIFSDTRQLDEVVTTNAVRTNEFIDYFASSAEWRWWGASSFVIRRDAFESVGGFTEEWVNDEDTDLTLRMGIAAGFVQIVSPVTFAFREHAASVSKDHTRLLAGTRARVRAEQGGHYPGGRARARERRRILTRAIRPVTISCLQRELWPEAWKLYLSTFWWNASLGRFKYLTAFPAMALVYCLRTLWSPREEAKTPVQKRHKSAGP